MLYLIVLYFVSAEVQIKVQVFDNSDLSPLAEAQVVVHGNQTVLASSKAGSDGVLRVNFLYHVGSWVIITASKQDYVTNSVPWHSSRIPRESGRKKTRQSLALLVLICCVSSTCSVRVGQPVPPGAAARNPDSIR